VVNIVGDHATYHTRFDAPLESDIASVARPVSGWYRRTARADDVGADAADAVAAAYGPPGCVATLVLPADASWSESVTGPCPPRPRPTAPRVAPETVEAVAKALRSGERTALLLGGTALRARGLLAASRISGASGALLLGETFPANLERGAGIPAVDRLGYLAEFAQAQLAGVQHLVLVDAKAPVSFFAYPGKPSDLVPLAARCTPWCDRARMRQRRWRRSSSSSVPAMTMPPLPWEPDRSARRARSRRSRWRQQSGPCSQNTPSWWTRATPRGCSSPAPPRAPPGTTG